MVIGAEAVVAGCAALTSGSWSRLAARRPDIRRDAAAIGVGAGIAAVGHLIDAFGATSSAAGVSLLLGAAAIGVVGVVGMARSVRVSGSLAAPVAEAVVVGTSICALGWALAGPSPAPPPSAVAMSVVTIVVASLAAFVLRLPVSSRQLVINGRIVRTAVAVGASLAMFGLASGIVTLSAMGWSTLTLSGAFVFATAGYLVLAAAPWVGQSPHTHVRRDEADPRYLPAVLVVLATLAVIVRSVGEPLGPVGRLLSVVVVVSLVLSLVLALRENQGLLADLQASRQRLEALLGNASDVIVRLDSDGRIVSANQATIRLLNVVPAALEGKPIASIASVRDRAAVDEVVRSVGSGASPSATIEFALGLASTGTVELRLRGVPGGAVGNLHDVTDAVRLRGKLERMARYDPMTGLANRANVLAALRQWLAADEPVAVLYGDLDGFKAVNDRFGHLAGDAVLVEVAQRLSAALADTVAADADAVAGRIGGDEFVVALRRSAAHAPNEVAAALVRALREPVSAGDRTVSLGLSIGIAASNDPPDLERGSRGAATLLQRADLAMFVAKKSGRSRVARWDSAMDQAAQRRVDIAIGLRRALDTGGLRLAYQPVVRLSDGVVIAAEALLRVPSNDHDPGALAQLDTVVSPAELVSVAEDTGAISEVGQWVLAQATRQAAAWRAGGHDVKVAVNLSVGQLVEDGFEECVARAIAEAQLTPDSLILEITEHQVVGRSGPAVQVLQRLRAMGVVLAIDDFGTGYSSLAYLRRLPVRILKVDRTLLDGLGSDPKATTILRAVVGMARSLGLLVIAEGLEDRATAARVRDLGAFAGQGFAISPAVDAATFDRLLETALDMDKTRTLPQAATGTVDVTEPRRAPAQGVSPSETSSALD